MKSAVPVLLAAVALASSAWAQAKGGPPAPPLMECGVHGDIDILCGTRSPEDLELTPNGKSLIVSQFVRAVRVARVLHWSHAIRAHQKNVY